MLLAQSRSVLNQGIADILNTLNIQSQGRVAASISESGLGDNKTQLDQQAYKLMIEEVLYDEKCLEVYKSKMTNYEVRMIHQKDTWLRKRLDVAKQAAIQLWDQKASSQHTLVV